MMTIKLKLDNTLTVLAGNEFGQEVAEKQIIEFLGNGPIEVIIPETIELITSSFVEGFTYSISKLIKRNEILSKISFSGNEEVVEDFKDFI